MSYESFLTERITIKEKTAGSADGTGGRVAPTWSVLYRRVPARFVQMTSEELTYWADKEGVKADGVWQVKHLSGIKEGHHIMWKSRTWEVIRYMPWQEAGRYAQCVVKEIDRL